MYLIWGYGEGYMYIYIYINMYNPSGAHVDVYPDNTWCSREKAVEYEAANGSTMFNEGALSYSGNSGYSYPNRIPTDR